MTKTTSNRRAFSRLMALAPIVLTLPAGLAYAHGDKAHSAKAGAAAVREQKPWGIAGESKQVRRTIELQMNDTMRFTPDHIEVTEGETLRIRASNMGQVLHEIVIGTADELDKHAALMKRFPNMQHDEPYMAHVAPSQQGEIVWTFNRAGEFGFACLIAGHYEAGMRGTVTVKPKA